MNDLSYASMQNWGGFGQPQGASSPWLSGPISMNNAPPAIDTGVYAAPSTAGINVATPNMFGDFASLGNPGATQDKGGSIWDNFLSNGDKQGWGGMAVGAANGLFNAWMGMKQYGLAKDQLAEGKRQFGLNYDAQRQTTNSQLEDRQRARVASNANAYQSVGDYMSKNGIRGG